MANFICAQDSYKKVDLYTKRGFNFDSYCFLTGVLWDYNQMHTPAMSLTSHRSFCLTQGTLAININPRFEGAATLANTVCGKLKCILKIGNYYYGHKSSQTESNNQWWHEDFVNRDVYFEINLADPSVIEKGGGDSFISNNAKPFQYHPISIYSHGNDGYQIDVPQTMEGHLSGLIHFEIINYARAFGSTAGFYNVSVPMYDINIAFSRQETELEEETNYYKREISDSNEEEFVVDNKIGTWWKKNPFSDGAVYSANQNGYLERVQRTDQQIDLCAEDHLLDRLYAHCRIPRKVVTINIRRNMSKFYDALRVYEFNGIKYRLVCKADNWIEQTVKLTLVEINQ